MLLQSVFKNLRFLILLIVAAKGLQAAILQHEREEIKESNANKVLKRRERGTSASGTPNDYGPAIKITSSVLQLTQAKQGTSSVGDIGLAHHETTLEQPWAVLAGAHPPAEQTVWLEVPATERDFHLIAVPDVSNYHFPQPQEGVGDVGNAGGVSGFSDEAATPLSRGLHTQIISSGTSVTKVSDNLDFGEVSEQKARRSYRTSYGK